MENHNHYAPILEFKDIDYCISKGRLSKKLTEKMLDNKNSKIKDLEQKLAKAVDVITECLYHTSMRDPQINTHKQACDSVEDISSKFLKELGE